MTRWANTHVVFYGDHRKVRRLLKAYDHHFGLTCKGWLGEIMRDRRGKVLQRVYGLRAFVENYGFDGCNLWAYHQEIWVPYLEGYALVASRFGVDFDLFSIEPDDGLAITTDAEGKFFKDRFVVFCGTSIFREDFPLLGVFDNMEMYFPTLQEVVERINKKFQGFEAATIEEAQVKLDAILQLAGYDRRVILREVEVVQKPLAQVGPRRRQNVHS